MRTALLAALVALSSTACGAAVYTANPASDADTTRYDERLIGLWVPVPDGSGKPSAEAPKEPVSREMILLAVGKKAGVEPQALELVYILLNKDDTVGTARVDIRATSVESKGYVSVDARSPDKKQAPPSWIVLRYDMPDADSLRLYGMNVAPVAADVESSKVEGKVSKPESKDKTPDVLLAATTTTLRAYLATRGDSIYRMDEPLTLRRVNPRAK